MEIIEISSQPIELCKLLKVANLVGGGGEAKIVISEGYVLLNQQVEFQKRKKIYHDDIIEFNGECIQVYCDAPVTPKKEKTKKVIPQKQSKQTPTTIKSGGRKRINL